MSSVSVLAGVAHLPVKFLNISQVFLAINNIRPVPPQTDILQMQNCACF